MPPQLPLGGLAASRLPPSSRSRPVIPAVGGKCPRPLAWQSRASRRSIRSLRLSLRLHAATPPRHPPPVHPARQLRCRPRNGLARRSILSAPRETATIGVSGFGSRVSRLRRPSTVHRIEPAAFPTFGQDGFAALDAASRPNATDESRIPLRGISLSRLRPA